jgi:hypothetical protein
MTFPRALFSLATLVALILPGFAGERLHLPITLPEGCTHATGRSTGMWSGTFTSPDGLVIQYEVARQPQAGQPPVRTAFRSRAVTVGRATGSRWMREETINGHAAYLACDAAGVLHASFPSVSVNLIARPAHPGQVEAALAVLRSYGRAPETAATVASGTR